ncbi:hypothetical protein FVER14953_21406 [Fusarium verticillioides]|nr:hypothetical protein FVER14953_21406 [Fusarium verticillioides]
MFDPRVKRLGRVRPMLSAKKTDTKPQPTMPGTSMAE